MRPRQIAFWIGITCCITPQQTRGQSVTDPNWQVQEFRTGFDQPIGMAFLGSNDCLVVQKGNGQVLHSTGGTSSPTIVLDLPVNSEGERGLLDIALHPNFGMSGQPNNNKVYLYYSRNSTQNDSSVDGVWLDNRLSQFTWNGTSLVNETVLQRFGTNADGHPEANYHNGGPITFGPDGKLYGITGDLDRDLAEQNYQNQSNSSAMVGGVYRLNDNGSVPTDNPFSAHANADFRRWYAYGIRNSFGLAFDPATGNLWDTENGPENYDEINFVARGFNSGWELIMGPDARDPQGVGDLVNLSPGGVSTYSDPEFSWLNTIAPTAIHFLHGSALGSEYDDKVIVADSNLGHLSMYTLNAARNGFVLTGDLADLVADSVAERDMLRVGTGFGVVTDLVRGPDGFIYALSLFSGNIYRIFRPTGDYNNSGIVDAADFSVWRDTMGSQSVSGSRGVTFLAADHSGPTAGVPDGVVNQLDYDYWKAHFGESAGSGSSSAGASSSRTAVPEPSALWLAIIAILTAMPGGRRLN